MMRPHPRLAGVCGLLAGLVFLVAVPIYNTLVLAPAGYLAATQAAAGGDFGPFLLWADAHGAIDAGFRVLELVPMALALAVPPVVCRLLWPADARAGRIALLAGLAGFTCYAVGIGSGLVTVPGTASDYAHQVAQRPAIAQHYLGVYAVQLAVVYVVAGGLIAVFLALVNLRGSATSRFPGWFAYIGLATAGLLAATAVLVIMTPTQPNPSTSGLALFGLALWLILMGGLLLRARTGASTPRSVAVVSDAAPTDPATADTVTGDPAADPAKSATPPTNAN